ncbi:MAG: Trm112 family protein [Candidatus Aenigmatarchaeota archaeon]
MIDKELLKILACPKCKGDIRYERNALICDNCRLKYKILKGEIPNMLIEDAESF